MTARPVSTLRRRHGGSPRRQAGQALTEMAVVAAVLVPLFLLVPTLSKYIHLKQTAQQAARSAAWEATVTRDYAWNQLNATSQRRLLLDRHFGNGTDPIRTVASSAGEGDRVRSVMMNSFSDRTLVERRDVRLLPYRNQNATGVMSIIEGSGRLLELLPGEFPPNRNGLVSSELVVNPRNLRTADGGAARFLAPFDAIDLELRGTHTVLADGWNAAGSGIDGHVSQNRDRSVDAQVRTLVPMSSLEPLGDVLDSVGFLDILPVVGVTTRLRPGYIQPDIVPKDRLKPYSAR